MDITEVLNKLNENIETNQKLQTGLDVISTHLDNLETRVDGQQPTANNQRNECRTERNHHTGRGN